MKYEELPEGYGDGPYWLDGVKGSIPEERRRMKPKDFSRIEKRIQYQHRQTIHPIAKSIRNCNEIDSYSLLDQQDIENIYNELAEKTSRFPDLPGWRFKIIVRDKEGYNRIEKLLNTIFAFHLWTTDKFLRWEFAENIIPVFRGLSKQSEAAEEILQLLFSFSDFEITELFFEHFSFSTRRWKFSKDKVRNSMGKWLCKVHISLIENTRFLKHSARKRGYHDKGSLPGSNVKFNTYGVNTDFYKFNYIPDLINIEGELIMSTETEKSYKQILLESLETESLENFLESLKQHNRQRDHIRKQTEEDLRNILEDQTLSNNDKLERILKNEQYQKRK